MPTPAPFLRRLLAGSAVGAISLSVLATVGTAAHATGPGGPDGTVASGADWSVSSVAGGYQVTLELDDPLPVIDDAPVLTVDGKALGTATESADGLSLSVVTSDASVADAADVEFAWSSGDRDKVEPTDSPVTSSSEEPVTPKSVKGKLSAAALAAAAGDDGATPGPYTYREDDYDYGDQAIDMAGIGGIRGELTGRIYLTSAAGARPTVILLHGRHSSCGTVVTGTTNPARWPCVTGQTEIPSYKGYDGTGQTLATWGYNVVSISANAINANDAQLTLDNGAEARGQLVLDSLSMIQQWNAGDPAVHHDNALNRDLSIEQALDAPQADVGTTDPNQLDAATLKGRFDLQEVGLMGHSRGGEGVTSAVTLNQASAQPFGIKSVLPLAPVDFSRMTVGHTPTLVMLPYCDGDVSNQQGQHFVDDSRYAFDDSVLRSTVWVMGANHNFFNTVWTPGKYAYSTSDDWGATNTDAVCGPASSTNSRLTADQQYNTGTAIMSAWFRMTLAPSDDSFLPMFDGSTKPTLTSVPSADLRVIASAPAADRVDIEPFTTFDGKVRTVGSTTASVCASASGRTLPQALPPCATTSTLRSTSAMPHWTPASYAPNVPASPMTKFLWTSTTGTTAGSVRISVPAAGRNVAAYDDLVFKTAPDESVTTGTDMTLTVVDHTGATWSSAVSAINPLAVQRMPSSASTTLNKIVLQQVSVPVSSITGIDKTDIREIRIAGAVGADGTATGGAYLSDLSLARSSVGTAKVLGSAPAINVVPTSVEEGNVSTDSKRVAVVLSKPSTTTASAWLSLIGSTATGSKAGLAATQVTFAPGETCQAVEVPTFGDTAAGTTASTAYKFDLSNNSGVVYGGDAFANLTVREDDGTVPASATTPAVASAPAVGAQGDVCAEYVATSKVFGLTASSAEPAPGSTTEVSGTGFRAGESVSFTDGSTTPATVVGTAIADASGTATVSLVLPADAALGRRTITGLGAGSARKETLELSVLASTTTTLSMDPATPSLQQPVVLTATVGGASTEGTVEFKDGERSLGTATVAGGKAVLALRTGFASGDHAVSARFAKTATASASSSAALAFRVGQATSGVDAVVAKAVRHGKKATVKLLVSVTGTSGSAPTGQVSVSWKGVSRTVAASATPVKVTIKKKVKGKLKSKVRVSYSGDADHAPASTTVKVF